MTRWQERLNQIKAGTLPKPVIVDIMRLPDVVEWEAGRVYTEWAVDPDFFSIGGSLFGGYVCALADQVACHTALTILEDNELVRTLSLGTTFFKRIATGKLCVTGTVVSASKSIISTEVRFTNDQKDLAAKSDVLLYRMRGEL